MKNIWIWVVVAVIVLAGLAYLGRHQLKSMLGMNPTPTPAPVAMSPTATPTAAMVPDVVMTGTSAAKVAYLTDAKGMTLYVFDKDTKGVSNCNGSCATLWPPYVVSGTPAATMPAMITTIKRTDGSMQYAYNSMPLYYYSKDAKAGDMLGNGVGGVWHIVKPQ